jgi:hypothetical protein
MMSATFIVAGSSAGFETLTIAPRRFEVREARAHSA